MKTIKLTRKQFNKLKDFMVDEDINYGEASFYQVPHHKHSIYKIYNYHEERFLEKKEQTVRDLDFYRDFIKIPELVLPKGLVFVEDYFKGISLDKIDGQNLSIILESKNTSTKAKIKVLKKLGALLRRIGQVNPSLKLAFGDVHPDNFMVSGDDLYAIDTDGMQILDHEGRINYFITNGLIYHSNKISYDRYGLPRATPETDIFCFIMILLQLISGYNGIYRIPLDDYKKYLDYLDSIGFNSNLLDCFASIYMVNTPTINPVDYLDNLTLNKKTSYHEFQKHL